ncbi:MAG TPA: FAD-linked oxidase C-terminal domain-containing protein [Burkholderiales bacterium]|nr:FAD-binding protein [Pseudomonadota bacterium]HVC48791.1 FAD-linked oxidase C-terminal domain-containing protein [Burkholderiales bacterium]
MPNLKQELIHQLGQVLETGSILSQAEAMSPFESDGLTAMKQLPLVVVLPSNEKEVCAVLRICHELSIPVVVRGAGTGLSGGALPVGEGVLLSMARFMRILDIDPLARVARVEPGVRNLSISQAAASHNLFYAPDPSSQIACTIGGNIAENSGGVHCLKYGLTVHNLLRLRIATMTGEMIEIGSEALDSPGYDLLALMTGSEGMLGVVTEATVRLLPKPESVCVVLAAFDDISCAAQAVGSIIASGILPAGLEMMDHLSIKAVEAFVHAGYPTVAAILLCELDGTKEAVEEQVLAVNAVFKRHQVKEVREAWDELSRHLFWAGRKAAFPAVGRLSPDYYCMDGTIPRRKLAFILESLQELSRTSGLQIANVFHAGDGNLHPLIMYDANCEGEQKLAESVGAQILELCLEAGGSITGEHGVGMEKINQMCSQFGRAELDLFLGVKLSFDPSGLLNPGKVIPTLHRCAEYGAMHVHSGQLLHGEMERF